MTTRKPLHVTGFKAVALAAVFTVLASIVSFACGDDSSAIKETLPDASAQGQDGSSSGTSGQVSFDAGTLPDGAPKDCFDNPKTHFEIINACTTATKITKNPTLTKLLPDGGLPPLN